MEIRMTENKQFLKNNNNFQAGLRKKDYVNQGSITEVQPGEWWRIKGFRSSRIGVAYAVLVPASGGGVGLLSSVEGVLGVSKDKGKVKPKRTARIQENKWTHICISGIQWLSWCCTCTWPRNPKLRNFIPSCFPTPVRTACRSAG